MVDFETERSQSLGDGVGYLFCQLGDGKILRGSIDESRQSVDPEYDAEDLSVYTQMYIQYGKVHWHYQDFM